MYAISDEMRIFGRLIGTLTFMAVIINEIAPFAYLHSGHKLRPVLTVAVNNFNIAAMQ